MAMTKEARAKALEKIAAAEKRDREQAFEVGFAKAASDMQLSQDEFKRFYEVACAQLAQASAAK